MRPTRRFHRRVLILSLAVGSAVAAPSQVQLSSRQSVAENEAAEQKYYGDAHPYLDQPLSQLKKTVDQLDGLKPAPDQEQLSSLLARVAAKTDDLLPKIPNLLSDEAVTESQWAYSQGATPHCIAGCLDPVPSLQRDLKFNYIILAHPAQAHVVLLEEYRTSRDGKAVDAAEAPHFQGFATLWAFFSSSDQAKLRFRYLGQQKMDGRAAFVIGFAQIPGSIEYPAMIATPGGQSQCFCRASHGSIKRTSASSACTRTY